MTNFDDLLIQKSTKIRKLKTQQTKKFKQCDILNEA